MFSAATESDMRNWIGALQSAMRGMRKRHSTSKSCKTEEEVIAATRAAEEELNAAIPIDNPLPMITKQRPRVPAGRRLPARAGRSRPNAAKMDPIVTDQSPELPQLLPVDSGECSTNSRLSVSGLCGRSLDSVGSLSFRSGKCSHDSGLGVDTPNALEDRPDVTSLSPTRLNALELAARLSNQLLNRTQSASPTDHVSVPTRYAGGRARSSSLDLLDRTDADSRWNRTAEQTGLSESVDALEVCSSASSQDQLNLSSDQCKQRPILLQDNGKCACKQIAHSSRRRRLFFFFRSKHKCRSLNELQNSNQLLISSSKILDDSSLLSTTNSTANQSKDDQVLPSTGRSLCIKVNRSKFYVPSQLIDRSESIETESHCRYRTRTEEDEDREHLTSLVSMSNDSNLFDIFTDQSISNTQIVLPSDSLQPPQSIDLLESAEQADHRQDGIIYSSNPIETNIESNIESDSNKSDHGSSSSNNFRLTFLQRKALFESNDGKRRSLDLLDQHNPSSLSTNFDLAVRPKSYGESN